MAGYNHVFIRILIAQARSAAAETSITNALGTVTPNITGSTVSGDGVGPSTIDAAAQAWLQQLVASLFSQVGTQGESHLISSTINGKSVSLNVPQGMTRTDVMVAAQTALEWLASGCQGPTSEVYGRSF